MTFLARGPKQVYVSSRDLCKGWGNDVNELSRRERVARGNGPVYGSVKTFISGHPLIYPHNVFYALFYNFVRIIFTKDRFLPVKQLWGKITIGEAMYTNGGLTNTPYTNWFSLFCATNQCP